MQLYTILQYGVFIMIVFGLIAYMSLLDGGIAIKYLTKSEKIYLFLPVPFFVAALFMYLAVLIMGHPL